MDRRTFSLEGKLELVLLDSVDAESFRGKVRSLETGGVQDCILNPSPSGGYMPTAGSLVAIYRKPNWWAKYLFTVAENIDTSDRSLEERILGDTEEPPESGLKMLPGETFIGRYSKLFLDSTGGAYLRNPLGDVKLSISDTSKRIGLTGRNFFLNTPGNGINIETSSSLPELFGDVLSIEKNIFMPGLPEEIKGPLEKLGYLTASIPTNISKIKFDALGGVYIKSAAGAATLELSTPVSPELTGGNILGNINLKNASGGLSVSPIGKIKLSNKISTLEIDELGAFSLQSKTAWLKASKVGSVELFGKDVNIRTTTGATVTCGGPLSMTAGVAMGLTAGTNMTLTATNIALTATSVVIAGIPGMTGVPVSPVPDPWGTLIGKIPVVVYPGMVSGFIPVML